MIPAEEKWMWLAGPVMALLGHPNKEHGTDFAANPADSYSSLHSALLQGEYTISFSPIVYWFYCHENCVLSVFSFVILIFNQLRWVEAAYCCVTWLPVKMAQPFTFYILSPPRPTCMLLYSFRGWPHNRLVTYAAATAKIWNPTISETVLDSIHMVVRATAEKNRIVQYCSNDRPNH